MLHRASITNIVVEQNARQWGIILKTAEAGPPVEIWIGPLEGQSIYAALKGEGIGRPLTHDLFKSLLDTLEVQISGIVVCDIKDGTFYAEIQYKAPGKEPFTMDARPSDAMAMAVRCKAPIFVDSKVIDKLKASLADQKQATENQEETPEKVEVLDESEDGERWAEYLKNLDPEEFGKYKV